MADGVTQAFVLIGLDARVSCPATRHLMLSTQQASVPRAWSYDIYADYTDDKTHSVGSLLTTVAGWNYVLASLDLVLIRLVHVALAET